MATAKKKPAVKKTVKKPVKAKLPTAAQVRAAYAVKPKVTRKPAIKNHNPKGETWDFRVDVKQNGKWVPFSRHLTAPDAIAQAEFMANQLDREMRAVKI